MSITVPFCFLPNSKVQVFDETCLRSEFQVNHLLKISQRDDFAYFVVTQDEGREVIVCPEFECPFMATWYDKSGCAHGEKIGRTAILGEYLYESAPLALDSLVYTSRLQGE